MPRETAVTVTVVEQTRCVLLVFWFPLLFGFNFFFFFLLLLFLFRFNFDIVGVGVEQIVSFFDLIWVCIFFCARVCLSLSPIRAIRALCLPTFRVQFKLGMSSPARLREFWELRKFV